MAAPKLLPVEEGRAVVMSSLPRVMQLTPQEMAFSSGEGNDLNLRLGQYGVFRFPWSKVQKIRRKFGIDPVLLERVSPNLRVQIWQELMAQAGTDTFSVKADPLHDNVIALNFANKTVDYAAWIDAIIQHAKPTGFANFYHKNDIVGFGITTDRTLSPKGKDDPIHAGVYVSFNGSVQVSAYNVRQVCSNGMLGTQIRKGFEVSELDQLPAMLTQALDHAVRLTEQFTHLTEHKLVNSGGIVGHLSRLRILNSRQVTQVSEQLGRLGDEATEYDLINIITAQQHNRENNLSWLIAGGRSTSYLSEGHCDKCGQAC